MADTKGAVLPFPVSPASLRQPEFTQESPEADADIRASMLSEGSTPLARTLSSKLIPS